jgi:hypothetical protein
MQHPYFEEPDWFHAIGVIVVDGEKEASNYIGMRVRFNSGNMQVATNLPLNFNITRGGHGRLALMDGDFVRVIYIEIGSVTRGGCVSVLN